jgi:hypothetical protein
MIPPVSGIFFEISSKTLHTKNLGKNSRIIIDAVKK